MTKTRYNAEDISVLDGLEPVRLRPSMYIGSTDAHGLHHLVWELVDNSVDEAFNMFADTISLTINGDGSLSVYDNGRGIPVDVHPEIGLTGVDIVFTKLHAGGKFDDKVYDFSGGLHGVGASCVNALSEWLTVEVYKNKKIYREEFYSPEIDGKIMSGVVKLPLRVVGTTDLKGTKVTFMPDKRVFETTVFDADEISTGLRDLAFLNKGLMITFKDERDEFAEKQTFCYTGGIVDFLGYVNDGVKKEAQGKIIYIEGGEPDFRLELAVQHVKIYAEKMYSFVNNIRTSDGGTHETGFKSAFTRFFNDYAKEIKFLKPKDPDLIGDDFREGMTAILAIRMKNAQFEGQTKKRLGNSSIKNIVENIVYAKLAEYFSKPKNRSAAEFILSQALDAAKTREAERRAKQTQRQKNAITDSTLVGKFASCISKDPAQCELFIVEGDSAGGSAKQGRDRRTQAVLPLRGKPLNVLKSGKKEFYENQEIRTIIAALGTDIGKDFNIANLRYDKIIILSDADYDGYHIRSLLLAFFYHLMRELIVEGKVYVGMPPLYKIEKKGVIKYAYNEEELDAAVAELKAGAGDVQRYKGLGEMSKEQLWDTTLDPKTRILTRVEIGDAVQASELLDILLNEGAKKRKEYIFRHAKFNREDKFLDKFGG